MVTFVKTHQQAQLLDASVVAAQEAVKIALAQYRGGMVDFNRVALLETTLVTQQNLLAQARGQIATGLVDVYRGLGGGWEIRLENGSDVPPAQRVPAGRDARAAAGHAAQAGVDDRRRCAPPTLAAPTGAPASSPVGPPPSPPTPPQAWPAPPPAPPIPPGSQPQQPEPLPPLPGQLPAQPRSPCCRSNCRR